MNEITGIGIVSIFVGTIVGFIFGKAFGWNQRDLECDCRFDDHESEEDR